MKICSKCHIEKDERDFHKRKASKDGLTPTCKDCIAIYHKEHFKNNKSKYDKWRQNWRKNNREKCLAMQRKTYYKRMAEKPDEVRAIGRKSRAKRIEKHKSEVKRWRSKNRDHIKAYDRKYQVENNYPRKRQLVEWREKNKEIIISKRKIDIENLNDNYIKSRLRADGIRGHIADNLIKVKRSIIKIKRLTNEKKTTS